MLGCAVTILGDTRVCQRGACILIRVVQGVPKQVAIIILRAALGDKILGPKWPKMVKSGPR